MLRIWGRLSSLNVRKIVWAARELGVPFERVEAGRQFGVVKTPAFLRMNPNALVPVIEDDGLTLWESNTIVRYLCAKHSTGGLYPEALPERFDAERWMDWQQTTLNPAGRDAFIQLVRTPPEGRRAELVASSNEATEPLLALLDEHFARTPFLACGRLTMADIPLLCEVHRWRNLPQPQVPRPHLNRWYQSLIEREATRGVLDQPLS